MFDLSLDLFGQHVRVQFERLRPMCDHSTNFCSLHICSWMCCMLWVIIARSYAYGVVVHAKGNVVKWNPMSYFSIHLKSGSKNMMNR